jgi:ABC-type Fe3+/spermidine/putrescine transport system ATPase subunit
MAISDRIAVMNGGRIEQVDSPWALYNRPKTPFVAQFIGRTNLLSASHAGNALNFDGFSLPAALLEDAGAGGALTVSVRPQDLQLCAQRPAGEGSSIEVAVIGRTYLGDCWDYTVLPAGAAGQAIKVNTNPSVLLDVGHRAWLVFDSRKLVAV